MEKCEPHKHHIKLNMQMGTVPGKPAALVTLSQQCTVCGEHFVWLGLPSKDQAQRWQPFMSDDGREMTVFYTGEGDAKRKKATAKLPVPDPSKN